MIQSVYLASRPVMILRVILGDIILSDMFMAPGSEMCHKISLKMSLEFSDALLIGLVILFSIKM